MTASPDQVSVEAIAQEAYQNCLKTCAAFEVDYLTDLIAQKDDQRWWRDSFSDHAEDLAQRIKGKLLTARLADNGCLELQQASKTKEPQRIHWRGRRQKVYQLVACGLLGEVPGSKSVVRHLCNNRLCIHPEHLKVGTQAQNLNDQQLNRVKDWPHL